MKRKRYYVGCKDGARTVFASSDTPTDDGSFNAVIGPFRTKAGAIYMRMHSHCESVSAAERSVLIRRSQHELGEAYKRSL